MPALAATMGLIWSWLFRPSPPPLPLPPRGFPGDEWWTASQLELAIGAAQASYALADRPYSYDDNGIVYYRFSPRRIANAAAMSDHDVHRVVR